MDCSRRTTFPKGFTLIELLVSMVVLLVLVVLLAQTINTLRGVISRTSASIEEFRDARDAFETMTRRVAQATLNSYDDANPTLTANPTNTAAAAYVRASELRFISGDAGTLLTGSYTGKTLNAGQEYPNVPYPTHAVFFQAPLGITQPMTPASAQMYAPLTQLLNTCGYFIKWGDDSALRPAFLPASVPLRWRFRLMEVVEPSENLRIYNNGNSSGANTGTSGPSSVTPTQSAGWDYASTDWFVYPATSEPSSIHVLAENIVFLQILPMVAPQNSSNPAPDGTSADLVGTNYLYDTTPDLTPTANPKKYQQNNQLPPMVYLQMVAVDDKSFARYLGSATSAPNDLGLSGVLVDPSNNQRPLDIQQVTVALTNHRIGYRIFSIAIPLSAH